MISYHRLIASTILLLISPVPAFGRLLGGGFGPFSQTSGQTSAGGGGGGEQQEEDFHSYSYSYSYYNNHRNLGGGRTGGTNMPIIVTVIDSTTNLEELCYTFQTLVRAKAFPTASIMAFHGLHLGDTIIDTLRSCTNRDVTFVDITLFYSIFPDGFVPTPGVNYDRQQTERFFVTDLWMLPHVEAHDVIVRVTDSTCLTFDNYDLPDFPSDLPEGYVKKDLVYQTQAVPGLNVSPHKYTTDLYDVTQEFMGTYGIQPGNSQFWENISNYHDGYNSLPKWDNTFEIVRKKFMLRPDVAAYHRFVTNAHADHFYNDHWSSEVLRYLTLSVFGTPEEVYIKHVSGYMEKDFLKGKVYPGICRLGPFGTPPAVPQ